MTSILSTISASRAHLALALGGAILAALLLPLVSESRNLGAAAVFLMIVAVLGSLQVHRWLAFGAGAAAGAVHAGILWTLSSPGDVGPQFHWPAFIYFVVVGLLADLVGRGGLRIEQSLAAVSAESDDLVMGGRPSSESVGASVLSRELGRARRHQFGLAFALLEIDGWNRLLAERGRVSMVEQLGSLMPTIRNQTRPSDEFAYLGSGRFAVVLPHTDFDGANVVMQRIAEIIGSEAGFEIRIGIAQYPDDAESEEALVSEAEAALEVCPIGDPAVTSNALAEAFVHQRRRE